jgi:tRNA1(Val) A37 N6-methylase TrmN6
LLLGALHTLGGVVGGVGVEQQPEQADRCRRTLDAHGFGGGRTTVVEGDLREAQTQARVMAALKGVGAESGAGLVVMNPPFFPVGWGAQSAQESTKLSTHAERGDVGDFLRTARALLSPEGFVMVVFDAQRMAELLTAGAAHGLRMTRFSWVPDQRPGKQQTPFRVWVEMCITRGSDVERIDTDAGLPPWDARTNWGQ